MGWGGSSSIVGKNCSRFVERRPGWYSSSMLYFYLLQILSLKIWEVIYFLWFHICVVGCSCTPLGWIGIYFLVEAFEYFLLRQTSLEALSSVIWCFPLQFFIIILSLDDPSILPYHNLELSLKVSFTWIRIIIFFLAHLYFFYVELKNVIWFSIQNRDR